MAVNNQNFMFVNKSKSSTHLSQSQAVEKTAIQRHVQTGRKRSRKPRRSELLQQNGGRSQSMKIAFNLKDNGIKERPHRSSSFKVDSTQYNIEPQDPEFHTRNHRNAVSEAKEDLTCLISQSILVKHDPFDASSVMIDKRVAGLLHYYMYYYHPSQWPNEVALLKRGVYIFHGTVLNIIKTAIADRLAMYCLLAASSSRLQFVDRLSCPLVVNSEAHYMRLALELMTPYIANADLSKPDQLTKTLTCIGLLGSTEAYRGNIAGCKTHFAAQVRLVNMKGGLSQVKNKYMQGHLAMGDLFLACVSLQPCLLDCSYDPGPAAALKLSQHELNFSPVTSTAITLLDSSGELIPTIFRVVITELLESHAIKLQANQSKMSIARATQVTHWITLRNMAIRHRLLELQLPDPRCHALRIAVIMWSLFAMNITGRAKTVRMMACSLMQNLSAIDVSLWANSQHLYLWITLIGFQCAARDTEEAAWLLDECRSSSAVQAFCTSASTVVDLAKQLELFQHDFFFDSEAQHTPNYMVAEKIASVLF